MKFLSLLAQPFLPLREARRVCSFFQLSAFSFLLLFLPTTLPAQTPWQDIKGLASGLTDKYKYTVPITHRRFYNFVSDRDMLKLSTSQYRLYMAQAPRSTDAKANAMLRRIANRLSSAVTRFYRQQDMASELNNFKWEFNLIRSDEVNAWCMPGGKIVVYEGILPVTRDEESLAIVLGHEIAHAIAKHSAEHMSKRMIQQYGFQAAMGLLCLSGASYTKLSVIELASNIGINLQNLRYSRKMETEADRLGLIIAAMAGYDPRCAVSFWKRMQKKSKSKSRHDWYSDHPSDANRIDNVRKFMPEAMHYYKKAQ